MMHLSRTLAGALVLTFVACSAVPPESPNVVDSKNSGICDDSWGGTGSMANARWYHTAVRLADGKVLVAGGYGADDPDNGIFGGAMDSAELYDPATKTWSAAGTLNVARWNHRAVVLQDGRVLVTGGVDADGYGNATTEIYDPATDTWSLAAQMSVDREAHQLTVLSDGRVLASGGNTGGVPTNTFEIYDPQQDEWQSTAETMRAARTLAGAVRLADGRVLVAGGLPGLQSSAEIFNPSTGTWSTVASMTAARNAFGMAVLKCPEAAPNCSWGGKVLVAGGTDTQPGAEIFDPASGTWRSTSAMFMSRRYRFETIPLADGRVMIAGGDDGSHQGYLDGVEIFDGALSDGDGEWLSVGTMSMSRSLAGSVELDDGRILITGGNGRTLTGVVGITNTAETSMPCPPNLPPVAVCKAPIVIKTGPGSITCGASAPDVNNNSYDSDRGPDDPMTLTQSPAVDSFLRVGVTSVSLTADDGMYQSTCSTTVTVEDDTPPVLTCPNQDEGEFEPVECRHLGNTASEGYGSAIFEESVGKFDNCSVTVTCTKSGERLPMGVDHAVACTATDPAQNTASCGFTARVVDTSPPVTGPSNNMVLSPANSRLVEVSLMQCAAHTQDSCRGRLNLRTHGFITEITSDEEDDVPGNDDGHRTVNDMQIKKPWLALLRAERDNRRDGRVYTIHYRVYDYSEDVEDDDEYGNYNGNFATDSCKVYVPFQSGTPVGEDSPLHTKTCRESRTERYPNMCAPDAQ